MPNTYDLKGKSAAQIAAALAGYSGERLDILVCRGGHFWNVCSIDVPMTTMGRGCVKTRNLKDLGGPLTLP